MRCRAGHLVSCDILSGKLSWFHHVFSRGFFLSVFDGFVQPFSVRTGCYIRPLRFLARKAIRQTRAGDNRTVFRPLTGGSLWYELPTVFVRMLIRALRQMIWSTSYVLRIPADETLRIVHVATGIKKPFIRYPNRNRLSLLSLQVKTVFPIRTPSRSCRPVRYSGRRKNDSFSVTGLSGIVFLSIRDVPAKLYPDA